MNKKTIHPKTIVNIMRGLAVIAGAALVAGAVWMTARELRKEAERQTAETVVSAMEAILPERTTGVPEPHYSGSMPSASIGGENFVGLLEIPAYRIKLPVGAVWEADDIGRFPRVYRGDIYDNSLMIGGSPAQIHCYRDIDIGAPVYFTDLYGQVYAYEVSLVNHVSEETSVVSKGEALTLFVKAGFPSQFTVIRMRIKDGA